MSLLDFSLTTIPYRFLLVGGVIILVASVFMLPSLLNQQQSAFPTFPGENGKIAFTSTRDGNATLEDDGTTITQDDVGGNITMSCEPPSSSVFPVGDTEVECSAADEAGNTETESFTVTVNPPTHLPPAPIPTAKQIIDRLISTTQNLDDDSVPQSVKANFTSVLKQISNILTDDNPNNHESACGRFGTFINQVNADERRDDTLTADQADELRTEAEDTRDALLDC